MAHRDKSQSPEFTIGIDAKRTFVDKRSRPNVQRMTPLRSFTPDNIYSVWSMGHQSAPSVPFAVKNKIAD
jgi:hypothetical protein